jgi:hypothetical protein
MKIKMLKTTLGATNEIGNYSMEYIVNQEYDVFNELALVFINNGFAIAINNQVDLEDKSFNSFDLEDKAIKHRKKK